MGKIYLHVISRKTINKSYKKFLQYECEFGVQTKIAFIIPDFIPIFRFKVNVCNCKVQSFAFEYLLESTSKCAQSKFFPRTPAWLLPVTNYEHWLSRCRLSLSVYEKEGWI